VPDEQERPADVERGAIAQNRAMHCRMDAAKEQNGSTAAPSEAEIIITLFPWE
jgi:hypothetical protein